ncbi:hypothetical protein SSX86_007620 [Deinandra increscens subsp. villosa]
MFSATKVVLQGIMDDFDHTTNDQRADADIAYTRMHTFEFVFVLHLMKRVMGLTDDLSQALQKKSIDIVNAIDKVASTKLKLNEVRNEEWGKFLKDLTLFCGVNNVEMPDMKAPYISTRYRPRKKDLQVTFEHYYRVDVFTSTIDNQITELNSRFKEDTVELLTLSASLSSKEINVDQVYALVEKYYPEDFSEQERIQLRYQLEVFKLEMTQNTKLREVSTVSNLCRALVETKKNETYFLIDRVVRLIMTLPVSTATTERGFSAMKILKNRLRNKMSDEYLADSLVIYVEKEIADKFDSESIIDEFKALKGRRAEL